MAIKKVGTIPVMIRVLNGAALMDIREVGMSGTWQSSDFELHCPAGTTGRPKHGDPVAPSDTVEEVPTDRSTVDQEMMRAGIIWADPNGDTSLGGPANGGLPSFYRVGSEADGLTDSQEYTLGQYEDRLADVLAWQPLLPAPQPFETPSSGDWLNIPSELRDEYNITTTRFDLPSLYVMACNSGKIADVLAEMGEQYTSEGPEEPTVEINPEDDTAVYTWGDVIISKGLVDKTIEGEIPLFVDDETGDAFYEYPSTDPEDPFFVALQAKRAFEKELAQGIRVLEETGDMSQLPEEERPPETTVSSLESYQIGYLDQWWKSVKSTFAELQKVASPSDYASIDEAYQAYVDGGGTDSQETWLSNIRSSVGEAVDQTGSDSSGWLSTLKDGGAWLGNSTLDLLKSWGPTGISTAYATKEGVDAVTEGKINPIWLVVAGGVLLVALS